MICHNNCCPYLHKTTGLTVTDNILVVTASNSTNIQSKDRFCLVLCQRPSSVVTGEPIPVQISINGVNVPVYNKYSIQMTSRELEDYYRCKRIELKGYYVNETQPLVIFNEVPRDCRERNV